MWSHWTRLSFSRVVLIGLIATGFMDCIQSRHAPSLRKEDDQYFQLDSHSNTYNYGYEVSPDGNFHHEHRDHNGVTYGCYGYIDSKGKLFVTHFIADRKGYRVVEPNKPLNVYLTDRVSWQAFLLPRGCGRPSSVGADRPRPELIFKPSGAASTTTTRRPSTTQPFGSTTQKPSSGCACSQSTTTKKPSPSGVLTPKPPSTTTMRSTTVSTITSGSTTSQVTTSAATVGALSTPTTPPPSKPIVPTIIDIDANVNLLSPSQYVRQPNVSSFVEAPSNSTPPAFYYVPYRYHLTPPPCVPSTAPPSSCNSHYGFIGLAPVVFVPIRVAKTLGLPADDVGSNGIPLRTFSTDSGGNLTLTEMLDDGGEVVRLDRSDVLQGIVNGGDFDSLKWGT